MSIARTALMQRIAQDREANRESPVDLGNIPFVSGLGEEIVRQGAGILGLIGMGREALDYTSKVGSGAVGVGADLLLNEESPLSQRVRAALPLIPGMPTGVAMALQTSFGRKLARDIASIGPLDPSDYRNAGERFEGALANGANPFGAFRAANEGLAEESPYATGVLNAATDPTNLLGLGGGAATKGAAQAGRLASKLGMSAKAVEAILYAPERLAFAGAGKAVSKVAPPAVRALLTAATRETTPSTGGKSVQALVGETVKQSGPVADTPEIRALQESYDRAKERVRQLKASGATPGNATLRTPLQEALGQQKAAGIRLSQAKKKAQGSGVTPGLTPEEDLILYHGSPRSFDPADIMPGRQGMYGRPINLTDRLDRATGYAGELGTEGRVYKYRVNRDLINALEINDLPENLRGVGGDAFESAFRELRDPTGRPYNALVDDAQGNLFAYDRGIIEPLNTVSPRPSARPDRQAVFDAVLRGGTEPSDDVLGATPGLRRPRPTNFAPGGQRAAVPLQGQVPVNPKEPVGVRRSALRSEGGFLVEGLEQAANQARKMAGFQSSGFPADPRLEAEIVGAARIMARGLSREDYIAEMGLDFPNLRPAQLSQLYDESLDVLKEFSGQLAEARRPTLERMVELIQLGLNTNPEAKGWYEGILDGLHELVGSDAPLLMEFLAITSPRNKVDRNAMEALQALIEYRAGVLPGEIFSYTIAGSKLPALNKAWESEPWGDLKIQDFVNSFYESYIEKYGDAVFGSGSWQRFAEQWAQHPRATATTSDTWHMRGMGYADVPRTREEMRAALERVASYTGTAKPAVKARAVARRILASGNIPEQYTPKLGIPVDVIAPIAQTPTMYKYLKALGQESATEMKRLTGEDWTPREAQAALWFGTKAEWVREGLARPDQLAGGRFDNILRDFLGDNPSAKMRKILDLALEHRKAGKPIKERNIMAMRSRGVIGLTPGLVDESPLPTEDFASYQMPVEPFVTGDWRSALPLNERMAYTRSLRSFIDRPVRDALAQLGVSADSTTGLGVYGGGLNPAAMNVLGVGKNLDTSEESHILIDGITAAFGKAWQQEAGVNHRVIRPEELGLLDPERVTAAVDVLVRDPEALRAALPEDLGAQELADGRFRVGNFSGRDTDTFLLDVADAVRRAGADPSESTVKYVYGTYLVNEEYDAAIQRAEALLGGALGGGAAGGVPTPLRSGTGAGRLAGLVDLLARLRDEHDAQWRGGAGAGDLAAGLTPRLAAAGNYWGRNLTTLPGSSRLAISGSGALMGGIAGSLTADDDESRREATLQGAAVGAGLGFGATTQVGNRILRMFNPRGQMAQFSKNLLQEAWVAQRRAMDREDVGFVRNLPSIWKVQLTSTLRNILQDEGTTRLWLANDGVKLKMMNDNWASLVQLYNQGKRSGFDALPQDTQDLLSKWGKTGYVPDLGANFATENKNMVDKLSAMDLAKGEALLSAADPRQGGIPILGVGLGAFKGYTRPFQQSLFDTINGFTRIAGRTAAFQDEAGKGLTVAAHQFLQDLASRGINVRGLDPTTGFTEADVMRRVLADQLSQGKTARDAKRLAVAAKNTWAQRRDTMIRAGEENAKRILGDYETKLPGERAASSIFPFISFMFRAYPRTARMMLDHPGISIFLTLTLLNQAEAAREEGLPGYLAGSIPFNADTPYLGGIVRGLTGDNEGTGYANVLGAFSPVGAELFSGPEEPLPGSDPPNLYQQAVGVGERVGFTPGPHIQALTYALNKDWRKPGSFSRTARIEEALPGPQIPSLAEGPLNFGREASGGQAQTTTPLDRKIAEIFYRETGVPIGDPAVDQDPALRALRDSSLDPESPIYKQARGEMLRSGIVATGLGYTSPATISARTDVQQEGDRGRAELRDRPPAVYDEATVRGVQEARMNEVRRALMLAYIKQANVGTQADLPAAVKVNRGASREARAKAALAAWEEQMGPARGTPQYERDRLILQELLGLV